MKSFLFLICLLQAQLITAQTITTLTDIVPDLPGFISDDDLRACISNETAVIPSDAYFLFGLDEAFLAEKYVGLGKITTKTTTIFIVAEVREADSDPKYQQLVTVACYTLDNRTSEMVPGGLQHYLTVSGDDAKHRQGLILYKDNELVFSIMSSEIGSMDVTETETSVYKVGKKVLEFVRN